MIRKAIVLLPLLLTAWYADQTHAYVQVWQTNLTLWAHAVSEVPHKPRPAMNYGLTLLHAGDAEAGTRYMWHAYTLAQAPHVPSWDRQRTTRYVVAQSR